MQCWPNFLCVISELSPVFRGSWSGFDLIEFGSRDDILVARQKRVFNLLLGFNHLRQRAELQYRCIIHLDASTATAIYGLGPDVLDGRSCLRARALAQWALQLKHSN